MGRFTRILYPPGVTVIDPKKATALFLILFSTQLTLTTPFSYLPAMVKSFGYKDEDRGYYAGMIASSLFVGRFFGGYFWGWITDKVGRRPVLLISASLTYAATVAFGFTTSFAFAMTTRFLQGLFNGVIVCGRAAFAEICDETNQAIGVALVFTSWNSAIVLGPALGGFLAEPVKKYPKVFTGGSKGFFTKFAFILPSLLVATILLIAIIMIFFIFEETMPGRASDETEKLLSSDDDTGETFHMETTDEKMAMDSQVEENSEKKQESEKQSEEKKSSGCCASIKSWSIWELLRDKVLVLVVVMFGTSGFCIIGFSELRSLWMATEVKLGGLSFSTDLIGIALLVPALIAVVIQPIIFGRLERKIGGILTLRISLFFLVVCTIVFPYAHILHDNKAGMWSLLVMVGIIRLISDITSRSAIALFINNAVSTDLVGRANGLAFSVQEIMRVAAPTLFGSLFAWSINSSQHKVEFPLDYRFPFMLMALVILVILGLSFFLPKSINASKTVGPVICGE